MSDNKTEVTSVESVDIDIEDILAMPGAESVMTPGESSGTEKKQNVFSNLKSDTSFLDKPEVKETAATVPPAEGEETVAEETPAAADTLINERRLYCVFIFVMIS